MENYNTWLTLYSSGTTFLDLLPLLQSTEGNSSGVDSQTLWLMLSAMGVAVTTLAGIVYKSERERRIKAEEKLEKFQEIAPDLAENVRWLVEEASGESHRQELPWPTSRPTARPTRRRPP